MCATNVMQKQTAIILLAELSCCQSLAENLPPEEVTPLMSEIHVLIENTVSLHRRKINRYTGDTFLIVFNANRKGNVSVLDS